MIHTMRTGNTLIRSVMGVCLWFTPRLLNELCNANVDGAQHRRLDVKFRAHSVLGSERRGRACHTRSESLVPGA